MLHFELDRGLGLLFLEPEGALSADDFAALTRTIDPYLEQQGKLTGLMIEAPAFPGWKDFSALLSHLRFVRDHHKHIKKIGVVTDSALGKVAEQLASHFVSAEIRHFAAGQLEAAKQWIMNRS